MLKVGPCTVGRMVVQLYCCTSKLFQLDGLLLFCIIMGLRSASSAIKVMCWCCFHLFMLGFIIITGRTGGWEYCIDSHILCKFHILHVTKSTL